MQWKSKIEDECCADELEEMIIGHIRAGFCSDDTLSMECAEYMEDFYSNECENITQGELLEIVKAYRKEFQNTGNQENF